MSEKLFERARKIGGHIQAPSLTVLLRDMIKEIERLNEVERQRDQLLAALKWAIKRIHLPQSYYRGHPEHAGYDEALAAVAAAEEAKCKS